MIQITLQDWEYEEKINRLKETIKHLETARLLAIQELQSLECEMFDSNPLEVQRFPSQMIQLHDFDVFHVSIPSVLPLYDEKDQRYLKALKDFYLPRLINSIRSQKTKISMEKAFVLIHQFFPDLKIRDLDNRSKRFIFNGLRQGLLIRDDSWKEMEYMEIGSLDRENPRTEIYVCESEKKIHLLQFLNDRTMLEQC